METRTLTVFLALANTLHFGRAADTCHMSPSTLTRVIKQLEQDVGALLFERDNRSVSLTREGELFRRYALESRSLWQRFEERIAETTEQLSGTLSLYGSVTASHSFMFDLLAALRSEHPGIHITLQTGDPEKAIEQVQSEHAHISIGARPQSLPASIRFRSIATTPLVFIVSQELSGRLTSNNSQQLLRQPFILPQRGVTRDRILEWFRKQGATPNLAAQVAGNEAIVSMVSLGSGVGVVPEIVLKNSPIRDRVSVLPTTDDLQPLEVGMFALRKNLKNRLVQALWSLADSSSGDYVR